MKVSVILCTFNRCNTLGNALGSIADSTISESTEWEVLIVDNNSSDGTREIGEDFCRRYPGRFRYLLESRQGKSYALNTGVREARGEVLAFVDDDVTVDPGWLQNLTANLHEGKWAGAGGRIVPAWSSPPPSWLPLREWSGMAPLVMFDLGNVASPLTDPPFGANMAFRRSMFEKYGTFRTDLGPGLGGKVRNNEDTEFGRRLLEAGERLRYEPDALVHHVVPPNRLRKAYFLTWWFNKGRADVQEVRVLSITRWSFLGIPLRLLRRLVFGALRWVSTLNPAKRFSRRLAVWLVAGMIAESYRRSRNVTSRACIDAVLP